VTATLDRDEIEAALQYVAQRWPDDAPLVGPLREEWELMLIHLRRGELRPVLDDWVGRRPSPGAVLDYIVTGRRDRVLPRAHPEPAPKASGKPVPEIIDEARQALREAEERHPWQP
jgi:hypothetical protein